ncbi:MAG: deoxyhypusine synthase family protein, partial [Candidatus Kerfeldbacteria bacterium]|nr:deoxyhypusine synthase family protein [Candidatus Kerfeldbacteria bacterium]
ILNMVLEERVGEGFTTAKDLMWRLRTQGGLAQEVAHGYRTLKGMVDDPDCTVFMTMSGAMTIAKMGLVTCEMIDRGMAQYVASTGALIAHGLVESVGLKHFKHDPRFNDEQLGEEKLNRVTDTLEPEENLNEVATVIGQVLDTISGDEPISPSIFNRMIGQHLHEHYPGQRGILKSAFERKVPVCIPAFVDSEVGNDVFTHNKARERDGRRKIIMDMEFDSQVLMDLFVNAKRRGIFSIGGGVPRNNTQNVAPLIEIMNARLGTNVPEATFDTGCRICPDPMWYGHLSGCTYSENASWRKMDPQAILQGKFAEVHGDATMIWPFIIRAIMDAA